MKYIRTVALKLVFQQMESEPPAARVNLGSLTLGIMSIILLNALISRPQDWAAQRDLSVACLMRVPADEDYTWEHLEGVDVAEDSMEPIGDMQGMYFLCDILYDRGTGWVRVPMNHCTNIKKVLDLYRVKYLADLEAIFGTSGAFVKSGRANPLHSHANQHSPTAPIQFVNPDAIRPLNLDLAARGFKITEPVQLEGPDMANIAAIEEQYDDDDPFAPFGPHTNLDKWGERLYAQCLYDLMMVSPNIKAHTEGAHTTLDLAERGAVTSDLYQSYDLPFQAVVCRVRDEAYWKTSFHRLFPLRETPPPKTLPQGLGNCTYWTMLHSGTARMSDEDYTMLLDLLWDLWWGLYWTPHTESDRLWKTEDVSRTPRSWIQLLTPGGPRTAVRIALNPKFAPHGQFRLANATAPAAIEEPSVEVDDVDPDDWRQQPPPRALAEEEEEEEDA